MFTFDHNKLRALREAEQLSQSALAKKIRRSRAVVAQWESGGCLPTIPSLLELCAALNAEPGIFFARNCPNMIEQTGSRMA
jgi:transcriptional regulator with XRE-family HTH domain